MGSYRLVEGTIAVVELIGDAHPNTGHVAELVRAQLDLEHDLLQRNRFVQAAQAREHAVSYHALASEYAHPRTLLSDAADIYAPIAMAEPRLIIGMAAAQLESYALIPRLVRPEDPNARANLLRAIAAAGGEDADLNGAAGALEALLDNPHPPITEFAAIERLVLAGRAPEIGWDARSEEVLGGEDVPMVVAFKAHWLERSGRYDDAESELLLHSDQRWAITELMRLAARRGLWDKAAQHADELLKRDIDWLSRFTAADVLRLDGQLARADEEFARLSEATGAPAELRRCIRSPRTPRRRRT